MTNKEELDKEELVEKLKDPKFYLENFTKVKTKEGGLQPFILKEAQKDLFNALRTNNRIMILKARQLGFSTAVTGYAYHYAIFHSGVTVALVGYNMLMVSELLDKVKTFFATTPKELRPTLQYNSKFEISFPKLESKILVLPNSENVGRGYTLNFVLLTELSSWEKAEEKMMGLQESVPKNGIIVIESCVTGDTILFTDNGLVRMGDIHNWKNYQLGFSNGKKIELDGYYGLQPTNTYYNSGIKKGFRIKTINGYELGMSSVHKLLVLKEDKLEFIKASELKISDFISIKYGQEIWGNNNKINWTPSKYFGFNKQNIKLFNPKEITEDLAYLIGIILGDGFIYKNKYVIITTIDNDVSKFLLNNKLGLKFYQDKHKDNHWHYRCTNKSFTWFLREYIDFKEGIKAKQKEIPKIVLTWNRNNIVAFLQGLFDADGCCRQDRGEVSFTSSSKQIVDTLRIILLNFGIISRTYGYNTKPSKKVKVWSSGYRLEIGRSHSQIFISKIGFRIKRKQDNGKVLKKEYSCLQEFIPGLGIILKKNMKELGLKHSDIKGLNGNFYSKSGNVTYHVLEKVLNVCRNKDSVVYKNIKELYYKKYFYDKIKKIIPIEENVYDFTIDNGHTVNYSGIIGHQTPRGMSNLFHRLWVTENEYLKKEYGWWWGYGATEMAEKKKAIGPLAFAQEYGLEFLSSGRPVFDQQMIKEQRKNILNVGDKIMYGDKEFIVYEKEGWIIYKEPEKDGLYVCGNDISEGVEGGDFSVATIWDRKTGEEMAMYRGLIAPDRFGEILNLKGREYNNAYMVVEVNNHGLTTLTVLKQKIYPSMYFRPVKYETIESKIGDRMGWRTTKITRPLMIDDLAHALREKSLKIHSKIILDEMSVFFYNDNGDMVPGVGFHDDSLFSTAIALQGFKFMYSGELTQLDERDYLPKNYSY